MSTQFATVMTGFPLFQGFTAHGAEFILAKGEVREHPAGDILFREGDAPTSVLLVLDGIAEVYVERQGKTIALAECGPGSVIGELAVLCGIPRAASVRANGGMVALHWTGGAFRQLLVSNVALSERILRQSLRMLIEKERSLINSLNSQ